MRRRDFIAGLGGAAATWPLTALAQQSPTRVIGFLSGASRRSDGPMLAAFRQGLGEAGYVEGGNVTIEYRWAEGQYNRLPALATELIRRPVAVIATTGTPAAFAAKDVTITIPIVFQIGLDPAAVGLVASLNRPGGNLTGTTSLGVAGVAKQLQLIRELVPTAAIIGLLVNRNNRTPAEILSRDAKAAADKLGMQLHILHASTENDLDPAFASLREMRAGAVVIGADSLFVSRSGQLAALTVRNAIPAVHHFRDFVVAGGLMSYGGSFADAHRLAGVYTGRILKGAKPADLPIVQPSKFQLDINLRTAKALGLAVPAALLASADEVIE